MQPNSFDYHSQYYFSNLLLLAEREKKKTISNVRNIMCVVGGKANVKKKKALKKNYLQSISNNCPIFEVKIIVRKNIKDSDQSFY